MRRAPGFARRRLPSAVMGCESAPLPMTLLRCVSHSLSSQGARMTPYAEARATIDEIRNALTDRLCEFCGPAGVDPAVFLSALSELFFNAGTQMLGPEIFRDALWNMLAQLDEIALDAATARPH